MPNLKHSAAVCSTANYMLRQLFWPPPHPKFSGNYASALRRNTDLKFDSNMRRPRTARTGADIHDLRPCRNCAWLLPGHRWKCSANVLKHESSKLAAMSFLLSLSRYRFKVRCAPVSSLQWTNQHHQHSNISRNVKSKWVLLLMLCLLLLLFMPISTLSNSEVTTCATSLRLIKELRTLPTECIFSCRFVPTKQQFSSLRSYLTPWSSPSSKADGSLASLEILTFHETRKFNTASVTAPPPTYPYPEPY